MTSFIHSSYFDFFGDDDPPNPDDREAIPQALVRLWEAIRVQLPDADDKLLGQIYAGPLNVGYTNAWVQTNRDDEHQDVVNLTLELTASELQLNLVGGTTPQREQLEQWLKASGRAFWSAHPDWRLVVFVREAPGRNFFMGAPWEELARYPAGEMLNKGIVSVRSTHGFGLDAEWKRLAYHVGRAWPREHVLKAGDDLVETLVASVKDVLPALRQARNT